MPNDGKDLLNYIGKGLAYTPQVKTEMTDDWDTRVTKALVDWLEMKMNEALQATNRETNMFDLTSVIKLLMREAPGVETFLIKNGADVFLQDEVEIVVGRETREEMEARLKGMEGASFTELLKERKER